MSGVRFPPRPPFWWRVVAADLSPAWPSAVRGFLLVGFRRNPQRGPLRAMARLRPDAATTLPQHRTRCDGAPQPCAHDVTPRNRRMERRAPGRNACRGTAGGGGSYASHPHSVAAAPVWRLCAPAARQRRQRDARPRARAGVGPFLPQRSPTTDCVGVSWPPCFACPSA